MVSSFFNLLAESHISMTGAAKHLTLDSIASLPLTQDEVKEYAEIHTSLQKYFGDTKSLMRILNDVCPVKDDNERKVLIKELRDLLDLNLSLQIKLIQFRDKLQKKPKPEEVKKTAEALSAMTIATASISASLYVAFSWVSAGVVAAGSIPAAIGALIAPASYTTTSPAPSSTTRQLTIDEWIQLLQLMKDNLQTMYDEMEDMKTTIRLKKDDTDDFKKHIHMMIDLCEIGQDALKRGLTDNVKQRLKKYEEDFNRYRMLHSEGIQTPTSSEFTIIDNHVQEHKENNTTTTPTV